MDRLLLPEISRSFDYKGGDPIAPITRIIYSDGIKKSRMGKMHNRVHLKGVRGSAGFDGRLRIV